MSVLATNSKRGARGLASVFAVVGALGMPIAVLINGVVAIGFFASLGDSVFGFGHARDVLGMGGLLAAFSAGILGWGLTMDYLSRRKMSVAATSLMWSIHSAFNTAIGVAILLDVGTLANIASEWPRVLMGVGYTLFGLLAMRAGIRDYIGSLFRTRRHQAA